MNTQENKSYKGMTTEELKKEMKEDLSFQKKMIIAGVADFILVIVVMLRENEFSLWTLFIVLIMFFGLLEILPKHLKIDKNSRKRDGKDIETLYAEGFLTPAIHKTLPQVEFAYWRKVILNDNIQPLLLPKANIFSGNCYLRGTIKGHRFAMSNYKAEQTLQDNNKRTTFKGQVYIIECPRIKAVNTVRIIPTVRTVTGGESTGIYNRQYKGELKVETENIRFNENYDVYANDATDAKYVLSPQVIERLCGWKAKGEKVTIVFHGNTAYVGVNNLGKDTEFLFSPPKTPEEVDALNIDGECRKAINAVREIVKIIESLNIK